MSHDTRIRGNYGTYLYKVSLREIGSSPTGEVHHSMVVRVSPTGEAGKKRARGVAQQIMDSEGMKKYYPAEAEYLRRY